MVLTDMDVSHLNVRYRLRKAIPVCSKKDSTCVNFIYLSTTKPTTFGRTLSEDVQVRLLSKTTPLMISRKHASVFFSDDGLLYVEDHNSLNGVYVSGKRIVPEIRYQIKVGDKVAFGCGVGSNTSEFEYYLETVSIASPSIRCMESLKSQEEFLLSPAKRKRPNCSLIDSPSITIIESNAAQIKEQEDKIKQLSEELLAKENMQAELVNRLEETEKGLLDKLECQKSELGTARDEAEKHLKELLDKQLAEKEKLRYEFDVQIQLLQKEKDIVEKSLQDELSCRLSEKDEAYQKVLKQQKAALEKAMLEKENEKNSLVAELKVKEGEIEKYKSVEENQKQLESCLEELKKEIEEKEGELKKQKEFSKKVEMDARLTVIQTMEDEFTCIICQELFVDATTLPCAHTFCELCLRLWLRKKKTCPVCRRKLKVKAFRSVVLDSAVEKMIESMDDDTKQRRMILKRERDEQKRREDAAEDPEGIRQMIHRAEDDDGHDEWESRSSRAIPTHDNRNRRDSYRRRSRSRSPRNSHVRHRPYHDYRFNSSNNNNSNNQTASGYQQNQNPLPVQFFQTLNNESANNNQRVYRGYPERTEDYQQYFPNNFPNQFNNSQYGYSNNRCYICGSGDHFARFCQRR